MSYSHSRKQLFSYLFALVVVCALTHNAVAEAEVTEYEARTAINRAAKCLDDLEYERNWATYRKRSAAARVNDARDHYEHVRSYNDDFATGMAKREYDFLNSWWFDTYYFLYRPAVSERRDAKDQFAQLDETQSFRWQKTTADIAFFDCRRSIGLFEDAAFEFIILRGFSFENGYDY